MKLYLIFSLLPFLPFQSSQESHVHLKASYSAQDETLQVRGDARVPEGSILQLKLVKKTAGLYVESMEEYVDTFKAEVRKGAFTLSFGLKPGYLVTDGWRIYAEFDPQQQGAEVRKELGKAAVKEEAFTEVRIIPARQVCRKMDEQGKRLDQLFERFQILWNEVLEGKATARDKEGDIQKMVKELDALKKESPFSYTVSRFSDTLGYAQTLMTLKEGEVRKTGEGRTLSVKTISIYNWELHQWFIHETFVMKLALLREEWETLDEEGAGEVRSFDEKRWSAKMDRWKEAMAEIEASAAFMNDSKICREDWVKHLRDKTAVDGQEVPLDYAKLVEQMERYGETLTRSLQKQPPTLDSKELNALRSEIAGHIDHYLVYLRGTRGKHH